MTRPRLPGLAAIAAVLGVLLVGLVAATAITALRSDDARGALREAVGLGDGGRGELTEQHQDVAEAAREVTLAFLRVDYRDMDPIVDDVLAHATGEFAEQYEQSRDQLVDAALQNQSLSTGEVVAVGVGDLDDDSARVFVAANSEVENEATEGTKQPRYYRLQVDLVREDGQWLANQIQFVG